MLPNHPITFKIKSSKLPVIDKQSANRSHISDTKKQPEFNFLLVFLLVFFFAVCQNQIVNAQANILTVTGVVKASDDNLPVAGVIISDANKKNVGLSDINGNFSIQVEINSKVSFAFIGYQIYVAAFSKSQNGLIVTLKVNSTALNEVVVTALGIKREEKALGYAVTTLKGEDLTNAISNNWTDALSGKVAGLNLIKSNGGPAGSNKIILRGENNLTGNNDALIVIDGVVINQGSGRTTESGGKGYLSEETPVDFGSGLNDINPEDIENVTVLKGPGAAALYGQRGANGAIIITTKSGAKTNGLGVTINSNATMETINRWPDLQYQYGQGTDGDNYYSYNTTEDGASTRSTSSAWGPKFDGQNFYQYDPITHTKGLEKTPWVPYVNDSRNFFETGNTFTNSVSLSGGNDKTSARFSATNVNNGWIIPNTGYERTSVALSINQKVTDKLSIAAKVYYDNKSSDNLPSTGYNNQSIMYWYLFWEPNAPVNWLKDYWLPGQENLLQSYPFSSYPDNPYLIAYQMLNKSKRNTATGNIQATYNFSKNLSLSLRTSLDLSQEQRSQQRPFDTEKFKRGMFRTQSIASQEINSDFLLRYNRKIGKDFTISGTLGGSSLKNTYNKDENRADSLLYPGNYTLANAAGVVLARPYRSEYAINSFYGLITSSYKDYLFLDVTGRNDWNSVLATPFGTDNVSFFYPSANLSFILSEAFKMPKFVSYAKLRASFAGVGSGETTAYKTSYSYNPEGIFPGGLSNPTTLSNPNLKPLFTTSYEVGTELKFFKSRFGIDLSLYKGNTKDQILTSIVDASSGVRSVIVNSGLVSNRGIEIALNGSPFKNKAGFGWDVFGTFSANDNKIRELATGLDQLVLQNGPGSRGAVVAMVGGSIGDLYGRGYIYSPDRQIVYNNGYPIISQNSKYIGNTIPKWKASIGNTFSFKGVRLNVLFDGQYGGVGYSLSQAVMAEQGKTTNTLPGRYNGIIGNGVIQNADGTYRSNDVVATNAATYYAAHYGRDNVEGATYSTDFIKLREARIDYTLPKSITNSIKLQRVTLGVYGRDLFTITSWPMFDPEFGTLNNGDINRGFEYGQFPSTRTFGLNLTVGI